MLGWESGVEWGTWDENEDDSATVLTANGGHTAWAIPPSFWEKNPELGMAKVAPLMFVTMGQVNGIAQVT